jgi:hypothetical protein
VAEADERPTPEIFLQAAIGEHVRLGFLERIAQHLVDVSGTVRFP